MPAQITIRPLHQQLTQGSDPRYFQAQSPDNQLKANPARRRPVRFSSGGLEIAGHLYRPPSSAEGERTPGIVMPGPLTSVKEESVPHYAERLAEAGYTVLTFDPAHLGESEGLPRGHYDAMIVIQNIVDGVGALLMRNDIDPERIGIVGLCMGGALGISAAARDKRVKVVSSIAGAYDNGAAFQLFLGPEGCAAYYRKANDLMQKQRETGEIQYIPTIATSLSEEVPLAFMMGGEAYSYYDRYAKTEAPAWNYQTTAASLEPHFTYSALPHVPLVAPAPLQIVHGSRDLFCFPEFAQAAYNAARGPKELVWLETHNHIELYDQDPYVSQAVAAVVSFLEPILEPGKAAVAR